MDDFILLLIIWKLCETVIVKTGHHYNSFTDEASFLTHWPLEMYQ